MVRGRLYHEWLLVYDCITDDVRRNMGMPPQKDFTTPPFEPDDVSKPATPRISMSFTEGKRLGKYKVVYVIAMIIQCMCNWF